MLLVAILVGTFVAVLMPRDSFLGELDRVQSYDPAEYRPALGSGAVGEALLHGGVGAVTARAMVGDREKGLAAGCDDYLTKPLTGAKLREILTRYLRPAACRPAADEPGCSASSLTHVTGRRLITQ